MQRNPIGSYDFLNSSSGESKAQATNSGVQKIIFHSFFSIMGLNFLSSPIRMGGRMESRSSQAIGNSSLSFLLTNEGKKETKSSVVTTLLSAKIYCTSTSSWLIDDHQSPQTWLHFNYFWTLLKSIGQMWGLSHAIDGHGKFCDTVLLSYNLSTKISHSHSYFLPNMG